MSATNGTLLVIGSGLKEYREYLAGPARARARAAGLDLVLVNNLKPTWQREYFDEITVANTFDQETLTVAARAIAARRSVVGVVCWDEPMVMTAALLAAEFGAPGLGLSGVHGCRDKSRTRALLTGAGLVQPRFDLVHTIEQARAAAARVGYPLVVKPRALAASMGVVLAADETRLDEAFRIAAEASLICHEPYKGGAVVEEFVTGPEVSVDAAVHKGEYLPMFVARKQTGHPPYFEELGHVVDGADPLLGDESLMDALALAHQVLGVEDGLTHSEVRLTDRGPLIVEVNGRLGGDLIPLLGKLATGIDTGEVLVDVAIGRRPELARTRRAVAGIRFGYPPADCVVRSITVPERADGLVVAVPMVEPGTELRLPPGGYISRHSYVVCEAEDVATCRRRLAAAGDLVRLDARPLDPVEPGVGLRMPHGLLDVEEQ
jgi:hypothetical protein